MFVLGKILAALVLPPGSFIVLSLLCVMLIARGKKRAAIVAASITAFLVYAFSTSIVSDALLAPLEDAYASALSSGEARAIVVLGGGYNDDSPEYGGMGALTQASVKRAIYGLELARRYDLPLIFSGGKGLDSTLVGSEAEAAGRLWVSLGMSPDRMRLERTSVDTKENAFKTVELFGAGPYLLVTSAYHMPRAMLSFGKAGASAIPAPTDYRARRSRLSWVDFLPGADELGASRLALHEYVGLLYYRLTL
jgi:uncharacterized SAM-binding protein YcdF (DUF218 family)